LLVSCYPLQVRGDKIVLKSGVSKYGTIKSETDTSVTIVDDADRPSTFARSQIKEIVRAGVNEGELESLHPSAPDRYFEIGSRYAEDADDPKVRACAQHLLMAAIDLDSDKYAIPARLLLARLADGSERANHLLAVLVRDSKQELAREQLARWKQESVEGRGNWNDLSDDIKLAQQGRPAPLVNALKGDSKRLAVQLDPLWPNAIEDLSKLPVSDTCNICKGRGVRRCSGYRCVGGMVSCGRCGGAGNVPRTTVVMGPSGGGVSVTKELCPRCNGGARWRCQRCNGSGNNPCQACANKPKANEVIAGDVKQKLENVAQILNRPSDSSWARELIVQDRSAFRHPTATTSDLQGQVKSRYYRRDGEWKDRP
jgi:hypothetical protein